ncbi:hypothetical protein CHU33_23465 [Superficieibacter electus]|uniref:Uncharacterized protein n=1 Tax=Superficieibacter electus TaxID=2022662 RepID=A0ABX4Z7N6_9ENTR|nr:hypothetical protein CHU33_23465 [Superficieibacter electus]
MVSAMWEDGRKRQASHPHPGPLPEGEGEKWSLPCGKMAGNARRLTLIPALSLRERGKDGLCHIGR